MNTTPTTEQNLAAEENSGPTDIFSDLCKLTIPPDQVVPSEKVLTVLSVRKPKRDEWVQTHPDFIVQVNLYTDEKDRADYLVAADALEPMIGLVKRVQITLTQTFDGTTFAWPVVVPAEVKSNPWHASAWQAAELAKSAWIRVTAGVGQYTVHRRATNDARIPTWPGEIDSVNSMLRFAFGRPGGGEVILSVEHPVVQKILGNA